MQNTTSDLHSKSGRVECTHRTEAYLSALCADATNRLVPNASMRSTGGGLDRGDVRTGDRLATVVTFHVSVQNGAAVMQ